MCPFLDEDREEQNDSFQSGTFERGLSSNFFKNDRKYLLIGGTAIIIVFFAIVSLVRSNLSPVNLDELPVIQAEKTPIKERPLSNKQVQHQDKTVYDNISGDQRTVVEKVVPRPENVLSIPEVDVSESLSDEEKKDIIRAFDELAPEKEYKINYVREKQSYIANKNLDVYSNSLTREENNLFRKLKNKKKLSDNEKKKLSELMRKVTNSYKSEITESRALPPIKRADKTVSKKHRLKDLVAEKNAKNEMAEEVKPSSKGTIMVQIASVGTKSAAESEYNRLLLKNRFLKGKGKKIFKVDLGEPKGIRYRIQVGPFKNKEEAKKIVSAMRSNGCASYISK